MTAALLDRLAVGDDLFEVLDGAVDEDALLVDARHRRHERGRAGRQHDDVVGDLPAAGASGPPGSSRSISVARSPTKQRDAVLARTTPGRPARASRPCDARSTW